MSNFFSIIKVKLNRRLAQKPHDKIETYISKYLSFSKALTVVDIGAHRGDFLNEFEKHYQLDKVVLIEPIKELAAYLQSAFKRDKIFIFNNAILDKDHKNIDFLINESAETSSILLLRTEMKELADINTRPAKKEVVVSRTLDSIISEVKFQEIDLIKIDVQGVEHLVLEGGKKTLSATRFVWIELSFKPLYTGSSVFQDIYALMEQNGFILLEISPGHRSSSKELLQADALFANSKYL